MNETDTVAPPTPVAAERSATPVWLLTAAALAASGFHQLMLLVPIAMFTLLPVAMFNSVFFWSVGGLCFLLFAWVVQPNAAEAETALPRERAPRLYERVDAMTDALGAPRLHAIVLSADLNAGAMEENRGVSLRPTRRVLVLGLPLLRLLDTAAAEAVIAHELGHFSRRHGRLGHWLYRTRRSWSSWARGVEHDEDSSAWDRAGAAFADLFLPWFRRASDAHSRRCEYEADALATGWSSPDALARALLLIEVAAGRSVSDGGAVDLDALRASATPPRDWAERFALDLAARPATLQEIQDASRHRQPHGSHPPHAQRLAALGVDPASVHLRPAGPDDSAAAHWLGAAWGPLCDEHGPWSTVAARLSWAMAHAALSDVPDDFTPTLPDESPVSEAETRTQEQAWERATSAIEAGELAPATLEPWRRAAIARAVAVNPLIGQAWLFDVPADSDWLAVVLRIDPDRMAAQRLSLERTVQTLALTMAVVLPADRRWLPRMSYTTEGLPPGLQAKVDAEPALGA